MEEDTSSEGSRSKAIDIVPQIDKHRVVRFNEAVAVLQIPHFKDFTEEERASVWYKKPEYQRIRSDLDSMVCEIVRCQYRGDTDHQCARGLESKTKEGARRYRLIKLVALMAVLDEQRRQQVENDINLEALSCIYMDISIESRRDAARKGYLDAEEALRIWTGGDSRTGEDSLPTFSEHQQKRYHQE